MSNFTKQEIDKCIEILKYKQKELFDENKDKYKDDMIYRRYINQMCSSIEDAVDLIEE